MSLTLAQEMLNVKLNCDGFMTDSESEEEEGVSKLSKKSKALLDVKNKPGVVLAVEEQNEIDIEGATKEKGKSVENQLKETLKPATEAYFAFLDQSWRELATKSPQLTPKQIQVPPLLCNYHVFVIYIYTGWFFYLSALKND